MTALQPVQRGKEGGERERERERERDKEGEATHTHTPTHKHTHTHKKGFQEAKLLLRLATKPANWPSPGSKGLILKA